MATSYLFCCDPVLTEPCYPQPEDSLHDDKFAAFVDWAKSTQQLVEPEPREESDDGFMRLPDQFCIQLLSLQDDNDDVHSVRYFAVNHVKDSDEEEHNEGEHNGREPNDRDDDDSEERFFEILGELLRKHNFGNTSNKTFECDDHKRSYMVMLWEKNPVPEPPPRLP